jgi:multidrug efflux pump subunit AcrB
MSVSLLTSLVLALVWTSNLGTRLIRRGKTVGVGHVDAANLSPEEETRRLMAAEEESLKHGFFGHILRFYERWMRRGLQHPIFVVLFCAVLVAVSYVSYGALGSDLLPAFDEGGFILDYVMPAGSSLQESNRVLNHVEDIVRSTPEVESTSRRTGLQLGLAAVTELNTGDFSVKLKDDREPAVSTTSSVRFVRRLRPRSRFSTSNSFRFCRT